MITGLYAPKSNSNKKKLKAVGLQRNKPMHVMT